MTAGGWLPDASVFFELRRDSPHPRVEAWSRAQPRESLFLSAATVAAIRRRTELRCTEVLRTEVGIWIDRTLRPWFGGRILPVTEDVVLESLRLRGQRRAAGPGSGRPDLLLAATARVHGLTVCARDASAYRAVGASAFDPWESASSAR